MTAAMPRLACRGLAVDVAGRTLRAGLDLDVRAGERWAIVGPNGAGKTTLVATLAGLRAPAAGMIAYDGVALSEMSPRERALRRGWLPQDSVDFFPATVLETTLVGRHPHLRRFEWESSADVDRARDALARFGLAGFEARDVRTLSGGERRRVGLAALVAQEPGLMLMDEPSSHLDLGQQVAALDVLSALARERGTALVMVLHDLHLALRCADYAIALGGGHGMIGYAEDVLTADAMSALFGHRLTAVGEGTTRTLLPV
ncbi:MAG: ABC transporter ATP-binding protein [Casimicrobiaceae bacterium]